MTGVRTVAAPLVRSCHPVPSTAVTLLAVLLALRPPVDPETVLLVGVAVLSGQLVIGWSNDLLDAARDREVGRADKPLATGELPVRVATAATVAALALCVVTSLALGLVAGLVHLVLLVGSGFAYNAGLKRTVWSWAPYAVAFGSLPVVVALAAGRSPRAWEAVAGALLGVGAHLLNVLPDLADDAATGVRGWPHRLGAARARTTAALLLVLASAVAVLGPAGAPSAVGLVVLAVVCVAAVVGARARGRTPFLVAVGIALADVVLLVVGGAS